MSPAALEHEPLLPMVFEHTRQDAKVWRGFLRKAILDFWALFELIFLPLLIFGVTGPFAGRVIGQLDMAVFALVFLVVLSLGASAIRTTMDYFSDLPRSFSASQTTFSFVLGKAPIVTVPISSCCWAMGTTLQDSAGEFLQKKESLLIRWGDDETIMEQVFAVPIDSEHTNDLRSLLLRHNVENFAPDPIFFGVRRPPVEGRLMGGGLSIGLALAFVVSWIIAWLSGQPTFVLGVYMISISYCVGIATLFGWRHENKKIVDLHRNWFPYGLSIVVGSMAYLGSGAANFEFNRVLAVVAGNTIVAFVVGHGLRRLAYWLDNGLHSRDKSD